MNKLYKKDKTDKKDCWDSELKVVSCVTVIVPVKLLLVCNHIASRVNGDEFSIVTDIENKTIDKIVLSEKYYIPKQLVSEGSIEYLPDDYHHKVVIHRHPDGINNFSRTDQDFINQNFELSLLYTQRDEFVNGLYNLKADEAIVPVPVQVEIEDGIEELDLANIERIRANNNTDPFSITGDKKETDTFKRNNSFDAEDIMHEMLELNNRVDTMESYFYK